MTSVDQGGKILECIILNVLQQNQKHIHRRKTEITPGMRNFEIQLCKKKQAELNAGKLYLSGPRGGASLVTLC